MEATSPLRREIKKLAALNMRSNVYSTDKKKNKIPDSIHLIHDQKSRSNVV